MRDVLKIHFEFLFHRRRLSSREFRVPVPVSVLCVLACVGSSCTSEVVHLIRVWPF